MELHTLQPYFAHHLQRSVQGRTLCIFVCRRIGDHPGPSMAMIDNSLTIAASVPTSMEMLPPAKFPPGLQIPAQQHQKQQY